jgi:hypothetical protein
MKLQSLALAAGLLVSSTASAVVTLNLTDGTNLGNFGAPTSWSESFQVSQTGTINHSLAFYISENLYGGSGVSNIPLGWNLGGGLTMTFTDITDLTATIYDSSNAVYKFFNETSTGHLTLPADTLFYTGNYTLKITGNAIGQGTPAGMYVIGAVTAPVPEPETWGMLLAGLGLVALRLRQKRACAAA